MAAVTVNLRQTNANQANAWQMSEPFLHSKQKKKNRIIFLDVSRLLANRWRPVFFFKYLFHFIVFRFFFVFFLFFWLLLDLRRCRRIIPARCRLFHLFAAPRWCCSFDFHLIYIDTRFGEHTTHTHTGTLQHWKHCNTATHAVERLRKRILNG